MDYSPTSYNPGSSTHRRVVGALLVYADEQHEFLINAGVPEVFTLLDRVVDTSVSALSMLIQLSLIVILQYL